MTVRIENSVSAVMSLTDSGEKDGLDAYKANNYGTGDIIPAVAEGMAKSPEDVSELIEESDAKTGWMTKYCPWMLKYSWIKKYFATKKSKKGELERVAKEKECSACTWKNRKQEPTLPTTHYCLNRVTLGTYWQR